MAVNDIENVVMENVRLIFQNFSGREGPFNQEGDRNFNVVLDYDTGRKMEEDGWHVRWLDPREEGDEPTPYLAVAIAYRKRDGKRVARPPRVVMIGRRNKTELTEDMLDILDSVEIVKADVIIRPYHWNVNKKTGVKAYLQEMYVTIEESPLAQKYEDLPDAD